MMLSSDVSSFLQKIKDLSKHVLSGPWKTYEGGSSLRNSQLHVATCADVATAQYMAALEPTHMLDLIGTALRAQMYRVSCDADAANEVVRAAKAAVSWLDHANCELPVEGDGRSMRADMNKLRSLVSGLSYFDEAPVLDKYDARLANKILQMAKVVVAWMGHKSCASLPDDGELGSMRHDMQTLHDLANKIGAFVGSEDIDAGGWISVKDQLPPKLPGHEFSDSVLAVNMDRGHPIPTITELHFYPQETVWRGMEPTHWMPVPALPSYHKVTAQ